jgi:hypothetical protein
MEVAEITEAAKKKVIKLMDEFIEFYGPNGRSLEILVKITKPNSLDTHEEEYNSNCTLGKCGLGIQT